MNPHGETPGPWWHDRTNWLALLVGVYCGTLFLEKFTSLNNLALLGSFLLWLSLPKQDYLPRFFQPLIARLLTLFLCLGIASALWSEWPGQVLGYWIRDFHPYLLILGPIVHLMMQPGASTRFLRILAYAGVWTILVNAAQYALEFSQIIESTNLRKNHYYIALPLVFFSPFLLAMSRTGTAREQRFWIGSYVLAGLMLLPTGARGAWLAFAAALCFYQFFFTPWRRILLSLALVATTVGISYLALPEDSIVVRKIDQGFHTSGRATGTWLPSLEMSLEKPWLGHGYGRTVYFAEYRKQLPENPEWIFRKVKKQVKTPHNFYLMQFFSLGLAGILLIVGLFGCTIRQFVASIREQGSAAPLFAALLASFLAHYAVRGMFETLTMAPLAIFLSVATGLALMRPPPAAGKAQPA